MLQAQALALTLALKLQRLTPRSRRSAMKNDHSQMITKNSSHLALKLYSGRLAGLTR